jgi:hypothetical protein
MGDWISEIKEEQERSLSARRASDDRAMLANRILNEDGPAFWTAVIAEIKMMLERLHEIGVRATISDTSTNIENAFQLAVSTTSSLFPRQIHTNVFYANGSDRIRCIPLDVSPFNLFLQLSERSGDLVAVASDSHAPLSPRDAASRILQPMVGRLR